MKRVYLITSGRYSDCALVAENEVQAYLKTLPVDERRAALITPTDLDADDLEYIDRTKTILKRLNNEVREVELNLEHRIKSRRRA